MGTQQRIVDHLETLQTRRRYRNGRQEADLGNVSVLSQLFPDKKRATKAQLKLQEKRRRMLLMQFGEGIKPRAIAKKLRVGIHIVYKTTDLLKQRLKKLIERTFDDHGLHAKEPGVKLLRRDTIMVRAGLKDYLQRFGIHHLTAKKVQAHIQTFTPGEKPLRAHDVSYLLKKVYHLDYKRLDPAQFRYRDPYYDEKRLWASRLLAQFQLDGALIISIDESGIRDDASQGRKWQFHPHVRDAFLHVQRALPLGSTSLSKQKESPLKENDLNGSIQEPIPMGGSKRWQDISLAVSKRSISERNSTRRNPMGKTGSRGTRDVLSVGSASQVPLPKRGPRPQVRSQSSSQSSELSVTRQRRPRTPRVATVSVPLAMGRQGTLTSGPAAVQSSEVQAETLPSLNEGVDNQQSRQTARQRSSRRRGMPRGGHQEQTAAMRTSTIITRSVSEMNALVGPPMGESEDSIQATPLIDIAALTNNQLLTPVRKLRDPRGVAVTQNLDHLEEEKVPQHATPGTHSLQKRFGKLAFVSPTVQRRASPTKGLPLGLTPVMEEFSQLHVTSEPRIERRWMDQSKASLHMGGDRGTPKRYSFEVPEFNLDAMEKFEQAVDGYPAPPMGASRKDMLKHVYLKELGREGMEAWRLQKQPMGTTKQRFSMTLISAISEDRVIANQLVEGGVDTMVYENFVYHLLKSLEGSPMVNGRPVVLLMDNANIHHQQPVLETALRMGAYLFYSAEYSPWLNPVEWYFRHVKQQLREEDLQSRNHLLRGLARIVRATEKATVQGMWTQAQKAWLQTLTFGHV